MSRQDNGEQHKYDRVNRYRLTGMWQKTGKDKHRYLRGTTTDDAYVILPPHTEIIQFLNTEQTKERSYNMEIYANPVMGRFVLLSEHGGKPYRYMKEEDRIEDVEFGEDDIESLFR